MSKRVGGLERLEMKKKLNGLETFPKTSTFEPLIFIGRNFILRIKKKDEKFFFYA